MATSRERLDELRDIIGKVPDLQVARRAGVPRSVVAAYRKRGGIKPPRLTPVVHRDPKPAKPAVAVVVDEPAGASAAVSPIPYTPVVAVQAEAVAVHVGPATSLLRRSTRLRGLLVVVLTIAAVVAAEQLLPFVPTLVDALAPVLAGDTGAP